MPPARRAWLLAALLACACGQKERVPKLAVAGPMSGELGVDGKGMERAVRLAVEESARDGGPKVELLVLDDRADPLEATAVANQAVADSAVFAVIGHFTSGCAIDASRVYAAASLPMITPSATAPVLTLQQLRPDWTGPRVVFRLPPSDAVQGAVAAEYAAKRIALKRVAIAHDRTPYGEALAQSFRDAFERRGGQATAFEGTARGERDFSGALRPLLRGAPEGLFFGGTYPDAGPLIKQAREAGFKGAFLSGDGVKSREFFDAAGPASHGAYLTVGGIPVESHPGAADFLEQYQKRWNEPPRTFDLYAYEAAHVALEALKKSGPERAKLVETIRNQKVRSLVGELVFDAKGDTMKALVTMTKADYPRRRFDVFY